MSCFFINGGSVRKYCLRNGIDYFRFYYWMDRGCTVEEALDMAKKSAEKGHRNTKHFYNGVPLIEYCRKHKLCYNVISTAGETCYICCGNPYPPSCQKFRGR